MIKINSRQLKFLFIMAGMIAFTARMLHAAESLELRIPACTDCLDPDPGGAKVGKTDITGWKNPALKVFWLGNVKAGGELSCIR